MCIIISLILPILLLGNKTYAELQEPLINNWGVECTKESGCHILNQQSNFEKPEFTDMQEVIEEKNGQNNRPIIYKRGIERRYKPNIPIVRLNVLIRKFYLKNKSKKDIETLQRIKQCKPDFMKIMDILFDGAEIKEIDKRKKTDPDNFTISFDLNPHFCNNNCTETVKISRDCF